MIDNLYNLASFAKILISSLITNQLKPFLLFEALRDVSLSAEYIECHTVEGTPINF